MIASSETAIDDDFWDRPEDDRSTAEVQQESARRRALADLQRRHRAREQAIEKEIAAAESRGRAIEARLQRELQDLRARPKPGAWRALEPFKNKGCYRNCYGYRTSAGKVVIEPRFARADRFQHGLAVVRTDSGLGVINAHGRFAIVPSKERSDVSILGPSRLAIAVASWKYNQRLKLVDRSGTRIGSDRYAKLGAFHGGFAPAAKYVDGTGVTESGARRR